MTNPAPATSRAATAAEEFSQSWRLLLVSFLAALFCGMPWTVFGLFMNPFAKAYGWSIAAISALGLFFQMGAMIANPFVGRLVDRIGVRRVALISIPYLSLALVGMSLIGSHLWMLYLAAFGLGCNNIAVTLLIFGRAVNGWFVVARGRAFAIMAAGTGFSYIVGPPLVQAVADRWGWRNGFRVMALLGLVILPLVWLWLRERRDQPGQKARAAETGFTLGEAWRRMPFRLIAVGYMLMGLSNGAALHLIPFLTSSGLERSKAAWFVSTLGIASLLARLITGMLADRLHAATVCGLAVLAQAGAFALLGGFHATYAVLAIFMWGFAQGSEIVCLGYCVARYFGLKSYGQVIGLINVAWGVGVGSGPLFFGGLHDWSHGYRVPFLTAACLAVASAGMLFLTGRHPFPDTFPGAPVAATPAKA